MGIQEYERLGASASRFQQTRQILEEHWFSYLLFLPTLLFLVLILWMPFFRGVYMSFHEWPFIGEPQWVGVANYTYLVGWEPFLTSLKATGIYALSALVQLCTAVVAALLVSNLHRFKSIVSGSLLVPYTMPPVVTGTLWLYLLNPGLGPVWKYLIQLGVIDSPIYWNVDGTLAISVVTLITAWTFWPFMFIIILASLENIPTEHYETGKVYGANRLQQFRYITLPQIKSAILVALSIRIVWNLAKISQPLQLTGGGPGYDTSILAVLLYRFAYLDGKLGLSYAVGMVLLTISLAFVFVFIREFNKQQGAGTR